MRGPDRAGRKEHLKYMEKPFAYPPFDADGVQRLTSVKGPYAGALMDTAVVRLAPGESRTYTWPGEESVYLLVEGDVTFAWEGKTAHGSRKSCFDDGAEAYYLHVPAGVTVTLTAQAQSEVFFAHTENETVFDSKFYVPADVGIVTSCPGILAGTAERKVTTAFDDMTAPYSNLVIGEIFPLPGKWCGYPPHSHPQPEVYYYRIDRPEGFGFCGIGDDAYVIKDRSFSLLADGAMHPQVTAPGYNMYVIWIIRHLPEEKWHRGPNLPEYQWLEKQP